MNDAAIIIYNPNDDDDDDDVGNEQCLNPMCENEMGVVGVCFECANSRYNPSIDGIEI